MPLRRHSLSVGPGGSDTITLGPARLELMASRLPLPMLARSGSIPTGDYAFELKWDGFRALISRNGDFQVRSRRGWDMTPLVPELAELPANAVFDGELAALADGRPHFPPFATDCFGETPPFHSPM
jgi:ATP-dependent DNA ligase